MPKSPLPPSWELPAEIRSRLGEKLGRQRAMSAAGHLLLILHAPPRADENERLGHVYWRKPDGTWQSTETSGGALMGPSHDRLTAIAKQLFPDDKAIQSLD